MNVLMVGGGPDSGASRMRAEQLGAAMGARVHVHPYRDPPAADVAWAEVVVIVKRLKKRFRRWIETMRQSPKIVVWDTLDFWKQPDLNGLGPEAAMEHYQRTRETIGPRLAIGATAQMATDCGSVYLPHHYRLGRTPRPVRRAVEVVGYEGSDRYLEEWRPALEDACAARGWQFVIDAEEVPEADLYVALRGGVWGGWMTTHWKSGVKYGNALAAGRPIITQWTAAYAEMTPPGSLVEAPEDLGPAFAAWADYDRRVEAARLAARLAPAYHIDVIAARYTDILHRARRRRG